MMTDQAGARCVFNCGHEGDVYTVGPDRVKAIIAASKIRGDELHENITEDAKVCCHRSCVSTYTSKTHIERLKKRKSKQGTSREPERKRTRQSEENVFCFKKDCLFCGGFCEERDPKNPSRWRRYSIVRTVDRPHQKQFKDVIMGVCEMRNDEWSRNVITRILGATADLHAVDARYHQDCKKLFMHSKYIDLLSTETTDVEVDIALDEVIDSMIYDENHIFNSVELLDMYHEYGGCSLSRRSLINVLCEHFGGTLIVLSSPGVASLLVFRKTCALSIVEANDDGPVLKMVASDIVKETSKPDKSTYNVRLNQDNINTSASQTLLQLLAELKLPALPSALVASVITSHINKSPTELQLAITNFLQSKKFITELHRFGITTTYDEFTQFKASAAADAIKNGKQICPTHNGKLLQAVGDNFDANISSPNGLKQTHSMALIITQENQSTAEYQDTNRQITRLSKADVKEIRPMDVNISRYKGPKNPPMPRDEAKQAVTSLKVLASQVVVLQRAQQLDFMFLKSIAKDVEIAEYNGFNTKQARHAGWSLQPATSVTYLPLIDICPSDPDTILTSMHEVKRITEETGQMYTVFTNDQQLYRVTVQMTWWHPVEFEKFLPRLGGMHMLMSFVGCVGTLMANSGLQEVMQAAFAGVPNMLHGKKFPQNVRALRMTAEEVLRTVLVNDDVQDFESMMLILEQRAEESRTTRLWLDVLIKPVLLMMLFVRAEREGEWPLHLLAAEAMLPYFGAAAHWNYFRYGIVYIMKMSKMPMELLKHFLNREHVMRHQPGIWNGIWSDMMIETTMMRYGHGPNGVIGITFNQKALERWALSMHISSQLQKDLQELESKHNTKQANTHKEEGKSRIKSDGEDRRKIRDMLSTCISPLNPEEHPEELVNIVTGKLATDNVNVHRAHEIGRNQVAAFKANLPEGFYTPQSKKVVTMEAMKKSVKVGDVEVIDTSLIYSRVLALQLSRESLTMEDVLKYELAAIPTSIFMESGDMRISKNKSVLKNKMAIEVSTRLCTAPETVVIDGSAVLWIVHCPSKGTVADFVLNVTEYVLQKLTLSHVYLVFDRYYPYSIKSATRAERGKAAARSHKLTRQTPLPPKATLLANKDNKIQLIEILFSDIITSVKAKNMSNKLVITGSQDVPIQVIHSVENQRPDLTSRHEEADIIMVQQVICSVTQSECNHVRVISDDTDVFVLLAYHYWKLKMSATITLEATGGNRKLVDIGKTVDKHSDIMPSIIAAHALSGCDTVAKCHGIGKVSVFKKLKAGLDLSKLGLVDADMHEVIHEATLFISSCYGYPSDCMTTARIKAWASKTAKARTSAPKLSTLPPTTEAFQENVKRAHFQTAQWYAAPYSSAEQLDPGQFGWIRDDKHKTLIPVGIPPNVAAAPQQVLEMIKCSCKSDQPCATNKCSCSLAKLACTMICNCQGKPDICCSTHTQQAQIGTEANNEDTDEEEPGDNNL